MEWLKSRVELLHEKVALLRGKNNSVKIIAVTKGQPLSFVQALYDLGVRDFGENRVDEGLKKLQASPPDAVFHFIGTLQSNKVKKILRFPFIHSIDSIEIAKKLSHEACLQQVTRCVLIQVNPLLESTKHGLALKDLEKACEEISSLPNLVLKGLMTIAPHPRFGQEATRQTFSAVSTALKNLSSLYPQLTELSMGMSSDFEVALEYGATILRIGSFFLRNLS